MHHFQTLKSNDFGISEWSDQSDENIQNVMFIILCLRNMQFTGKKNTRMNNNECLLLCPFKE